jgi:curved DNA-binding protein
VFTGDEDELRDLFSGLFGAGAGGPEGFSARGPDQLAEVEITLGEAARGGRRTLTLPDGTTVSVTIPAGSIDGRRLRLAGRGSPGLGAGPPGDLFVDLVIAPDPRFRLDGRDLFADLPVAPWEAALGASVEAPTLDRPVRVKVPPGSSSGRRLRLKGKGLPGSGGEAAGDLYVTVVIRTPERLGERERELFEELGRVSDFTPRGRT